MNAFDTMLEALAPFFGARIPAGAALLGLLLQAATLPFLAGAALIGLDLAPAMHLIALGAILCIVKPARDAWVLLVEIHR